MTFFRFRQIVFRMSRGKQLVSFSCCNIPEVSVSNISSKISTSRLVVHVCMEISQDTMEKCVEARRSAILALRTDCVACSTEVLRLCRYDIEDPEEFVANARKSTIRPPVSTIPTNMDMQVSRCNLAFNEDGLIVIDVSLECSARFYFDKYEDDFKGDFDNEYVILLQVHFDRVLSNLHSSHQQKKQKIEELKVDTICTDSASQDCMPNPRKSINQSTSSPVAQNRNFCTGKSQQSTSTSSALLTSIEAAPIAPAEVFTRTIPVKCERESPSRITNATKQTNLSDDEDDHVEIVIRPPAKRLLTSQNSPSASFATAKNITIVPYSPPTYPPPVNKTASSMISSPPFPKHNLLSTYIAITAHTNTTTPKNRTAIIPTNIAPVIAPTTPIIPADALATNQPPEDPTLIQAKTVAEYDILKTRLERFRSLLYISPDSESDPNRQAFAKDFYYPRFQPYAIRIRVIAFTLPCEETCISPSLGKGRMEKNSGFLQEITSDGSFTVYFPISDNILTISCQDILYVCNEEKQLHIKRVPSILYDRFGTALPRAFKKLSGSVFSASVLSTNGFFLLRCINDDHKFRMCQIALKNACMSDSYMVKYYDPQENLNQRNSLQILLENDKIYTLAELHNNVLFYTDVNKVQRGLITGKLADVLNRNKELIGYKHYYQMLEHFL
jgi:hypothetical protein